MDSVQINSLKDIGGGWHANQKPPNRNKIEGIYNIEKVLEGIRTHDNRWWDKLGYIGMGFTFKSSQKHTLMQALLVFFKEIEKEIPRWVGHLKIFIEKMKSNMDDIY